MKDFIPKGTGNSRWMKSSIPTGTTWEEALAMLRAGTFPFDLNGVNSAGVAQMGDALNKANLLPDAVGALYGLGADAVPSDVLKALAKSALIEQTGGEPLRTEKSLSTLPAGTQIYSDESSSFKMYTTKATDYLKSGSLILMVISNNQNYWSSNGQSTYQNSDLDKYAQSLKLPSRVQSNLVSLPVPVDGTTLNRSVFAFSATEVGVTNYSPPVEGKNIVTSTLKNIVTRTSWLRTTQTNDTPYAYWFSESYGGVDRKNSYTHDYVFGVSVSKTLKVYLDEDGKYYFEQKYTPVDTKLTDVLGQYIGNAIKIVTGSYSGTGKYNKDNPNSLKLDGTPIVVFVRARGYNKFNFAILLPITWGSSTVLVENYAYAVAGTDSGSTTKSLEVGFSMYGYVLGNTMYWYSTNSTIEQLNQTGFTYDYVAFVM